MNEVAIPFSSGLCFRQNHTPQRHSRRGINGVAIPFSSGLCFRQRNGPETEKSKWKSRVAIPFSSGLCFRRNEPNPGGRLPHHMSQSLFHQGYVSDEIPYNNSYYTNLPYESQSLFHQGYVSDCG